MSLRVLDWHREEREKLNVWVAYLNLENLHGSEEAVMKLFQRALSYADQKKLYLALITILDCTNRVSRARTFALIGSACSFACEKDTI